MQMRTVARLAAALCVLTAGTLAAAQPRESQNENDARQAPPALDARDDADARPPEGASDGEAPVQDEANPSQDARGRAELGIAIAPSRGEGVLVADVRPGSPADQAGVMAGDYILAIGEQTIGSPRELATIVERAQAGEELSLTVWRDGEEHAIRVAPEVRQESGFRGGSAEGPDDADTAWLGVLLSEEERDRGVEITQVFPSGPASRANLRAGDVIVAIDGEAVSTPEEVSRAIEQAEPDQRANIKVLRGDDELETSVRLGRRSEFLGGFGGGDGFMDDFGGMADQFGGFGGHIPEHAVMLEYQRRQTEHIQRLERLVRELTQEVRELRRQVGGDASPPVAPNPTDAATTPPADAGAAPPARDR